MRILCTSYRKNSCDSTGGTVKCLLARASLQNISVLNVLNVNEMYEFTSHIDGIKVFKVTESGVERHINTFDLENISSKIQWDSIPSFLYTKRWCIRNM